MATNSNADGSNPDGSYVHDYTGLARNVQQAAQQQPTRRRRITGVSTPGQGLGSATAHQARTNQ